MPAVSTATESMLANDIYERLALVFPSATITKGTDANGYPTLQYGAGTAGTQSFFTKVVPASEVSGTDSLGLTQRVYHPHTVQLAVEESATTNVWVLLSTTYSQVMKALEAVGCKIEIYKSANTEAATNATITGTPIVTIWPDLYNKMKQAQ